MPTSPPSLARTAWLVVLLLMPVALLNYLDRQMLAAMRTSFDVKRRPFYVNGDDRGEAVRELFA